VGQGAGNGNLGLAAQAALAAENLEIHAAGKFHRRKIVARF
jgi:hypothetical protein